MYNALSNIDRQVAYQYFSGTIKARVSFYTDPLRIFGGRMKVLSIIAR